MGDEKSEGRIGVEKEPTVFAPLEMEDRLPLGWPQETNWFPSSSTGFDEHHMVSCVPPLEPDSSSSATFQANRCPFWPMPVQETAEGKAASNSKSHSQAEKRRRDRINAHLGTLRKLIPKSDEMDKAALLASVIDHVKDLKKMAAQVSQSATVPTDADEVTVDCVVPQDTNSHNNALIRASLSCDDRPELFPELIQVLKGLELNVIAADIASVGGRMRSVLVLRNNDNKDVVPFGTIKQSLNQVLSRIASSSMPTDRRFRSKRQRFFLPSCQSQ